MAIRAAEDGQITGEIDLNLSSDSLGYPAVVDPTSPNRLREWRLKRAKVVPSAFSIIEMARRLRVSERTYRDWEGGHHLPSRKARVAIAKALGVEVADLGLEDRAGPKENGA